MLYVTKAVAVTKYFVQNNDMKRLSGLEFPFFVTKHVTLLGLTHPEEVDICVPVVNRKRM